MVEQHPAPSPVTMDSLISDVGLGKWNCLFFVVSCLSAAFGPVGLVGSVFLVPEVNFTCAAPSLSWGRLTTMSTAPPPPGFDSRCHVLVTSHNSTEHWEECTAFTYDHSTYVSTLTEEFDLVCSRAPYRQLFQLVLTMGCLVGSPLGGVLADRVGRQRAVWLSSLGTAAVTFLLLLGARLPLWGVLAARFALGVGAFAIHVGAYTAGQEVCPLTHRSLLGMVVALPYAVMMVVVAGVAWGARYWRVVLLGGSVPLFLLTLCSSPCVLDESPRWLVSKRREEEAERVLLRGARLNRTEHRLPKDLGSVLGEFVKDQTPTASSTSFSHLVSLVASPYMRKVTIAVSMLSFIHGALFMSIPLRAEAFSSPFLYVASLGAAEAPAYLLGGFVVARTGRRAFLWGSLAAVTILLGTIAGLTAQGYAQFPASKNNKLKMFEITGAFMTVLSALTYCVVTAGYQTNNVYNSELFPTSVRGLGCSIAYAACTMGFCIPPLLELMLPHMSSWIPMILYTCLCPVGATFILLLPETKNRPIVESVEEELERNSKHYTECKDYTNECKDYTNKCKDDKDVTRSESSYLLSKE